MGPLMSQGCRVPSLAGPSGASEALPRTMYTYLLWAAWPCSRTLGDHVVTLLSRLAIVHLTSLPRPESLDLPQSPFSPGPPPIVTTPVYGLDPRSRVRNTLRPQFFFIREEMRCNNASFTFKEMSWRGRDH